MVRRCFLAFSLVLAIGCGVDPRPIASVSEAKVEVLAPPYNGGGVDIPGWREIKEGRHGKPFVLSRGPLLFRWLMPRSGDPDYCIVSVFNANEEKPYVIDCFPVSGGGQKIMDLPPGRYTFAPNSSRGNNYCRMFFFEQDSR